MKERFRELYENYQGAIYGYLFYMTHDEQTAQDLSQETFLKIYLGLKRVKKYPLTGGAARNQS
jgi:RNA polymerase sigma-70 factor (ECF subfamily)